MTEKSNAWELLDRVFALKDVPVPGNAITVESLEEYLKAKGLGYSRTQLRYRIKEMRKKGWTSGIAVLSGKRVQYLIPPA